MPPFVRLPRHRPPAGAGGGFLTGQWNERSYSVSPQTAALRGHTLPVGQLLGLYDGTFCFALISAIRFIVFSVLVTCVLSFIPMPR